jgi:hypothetical protein
LSALNIQIKNNKSEEHSDDKVWVMAEYDGTVKLGPKKLSDLTQINPHTYNLFDSDQPNIPKARIYFSYGDNSMPKSAILNPIDPNVKNIRYDWVELTYTGDPADCANLTAVNQLGIPMMLETFCNSTKVQNVGYKNSFNTLRDNLWSLNPKAFIGENDKTFIRVVSPNNGNDTHAKSWAEVSDFKSYLNSLAGKTFELKGLYYGNGSWASCSL